MDAHFCKSHSLMIALLSALLISCSSRSNNGPVGEVEDPISDNSTSQDPDINQPPAMSDPSSSIDFAAVINGSLPSPLNQSLYCEANSFTYNLILRSDTSAEYSDQDGGFLTGNYQISSQALNIQLSSGESARSIYTASAGNLLVGVNLLSADGTISNCIARAHTSRDTLPEGIAIRCGRRNIGGEESNTFTLNQDGSAVWESLFELPGGVDTTRRQRLGTFLYDATTSAVQMAFKQLGSDEILLFDGVGDQTSFQMSGAPATGDGAQAAGQTCGYL